MSDCRFCDCPCFLTDQTCLYSFTPLNPTISETEIQVALFSAQDLHIRGLLGDCYDDLCAAIKASKENPPTVLAQKWIDLRDNLKMTLVWFTYYEWLRQFGNVKHTAKGTVKKSADDSEPADIADVKLQIDVAWENGQMYLNQLKTFIKDNISTYTCIDDALENCPTRIDDVDSFERAVDVS